MGKPLTPGGGGGGGGGDGGSKAGTTFVQADSACFRDLVQRLTGPLGNQAPAAPKIPTSPPIGGPWSCPASPSSMTILSAPNSLQASPVSTPVPVGNSNKRALPSEMEMLNPEEEEKAIKEKRFYLHPSPRSKPRLAAEPELLPLFPLKSPTSSTASNDT